MLASRHALSSFLLILSFLALIPLPVAADPPPWAPAHGYRHKHHGYPQAPTVREAPPVLPWYTRNARNDYIRGGRCDRASLGAFLGGMTGGLVGSQLGRGDDRAMATVAGTLIGILVGRAIGHQMDTTDQQCTGQVLEHVPDREPIRWQDPDNHTAYEVTPVRTYRNREGRYCREYTTRANVGGRINQMVGQACRQPDGSWVTR